MRWRSLSLLSKIWLSTSVALTVLFLLTGYVLQRASMASAMRGLEEEVGASFRAYESLWRSRADTLGALTAILSSMPNVRGAFSTHDAATIRDTTAELWSLISDRLKETAFFLVSDPQGRVIASLDNATSAAIPREWPVVKAVSGNFPKQASGFIVHEGQLYQIVLTPVYVDSARGPGLINVLVAGYTVNHLVAQRFKEATGGSEFVFTSQGRVFATTLNDRATRVLVRGAKSGGLMSDGVSEYASLVRELIDLEGKPVGRLLVFRSFEGARQRLAQLRVNLVMVWLAAVGVGLLLTYLLARRIVQPLEALDQAAAEVGRQNYGSRVEVKSEDELGRLAATFNSMCTSIQAARAELIRQERISTIGRMASSIVHDLRNPLAAIYGGAEMLVDTEPSPGQVKRLAGNIYRASRRIKDMLDDLVNVARGRSGAVEPHDLGEVVRAALEPVAADAQSRGVQIVIEDSFGGVEAPVDRARIERVFVNLFENALDVMPEGGRITISTRRDGEWIVIEVADTGPGISSEIAGQLFQPFVTYGKRNGLGLGLALARQTLLDHGGDMWVESEPGCGARFYLRLPASAGANVRPIPQPV